MLFNSIDYLLFFPVVFLVYFIVPKKVRYLWLLVTSYFFYMCWSVEYALLMLTSTVITYLSGLFIQRFNDAGKKGLSKLCVALSFISNLAILGFFKYGNFIVENVNALISALGMYKQLNSFTFLLPVGISFYTFQALSYTMDTYRGELRAEKNPFKYALFVSFFPQLVAGPIERSPNLLTQIQNLPPFQVKKARGGLLLIAWGLFLKVVIADGIATIINPIFTQYETQSGVILLLAIVMFAVQIYCDFAGYSQIARGSANVLGFTLMENFNAPYLARSIADFWRRWHISLTTWFRDYLYFPLGGNRKGKVRKYINQMIVFLVSGLWHGANWTFVVWGAMNGVMMVIGETTKNLRLRGLKLLHINPDTFSHRLFQRVLTFVLICLTWIFFRASSLEMAMSMLGRITQHLELHTLFSPKLFDIFGSTQTALVLLLSVFIMLAVDTLHYKGVNVIERFHAQGWLFRWTVYLGLTLIIIVFGIYGNFYARTQFIYFQF